MSGESKPRTEAERLAGLEAVIGELNDKIEDLESEVASLETDAEDRAAIQLGAYRAILADLDALFGLKHLPFAVQASLAAFGEML
jgi:hypothetical protein